MFRSRAKKTDKLQSAKTKNKEIVSQDIACCEETVSLADLFAVFLNRKKLFVSIVLFCVMGGVVAALFHQNSYMFSRSLQVAGYYKDNQFTPLQNSEHTEFMMNNLFKPQVVREINDKFNVQLLDRNVQVSQMNNKNYLNISILGQEKNTEVYKTIFKTLLTMLIAHEQHLIPLRKEILSNQVQDAKQYLVAEKGQVGLLKDEFKSIDKDLSGMRNTYRHSSSSRSGTKSSSNYGAADGLLLMSTLNKQSMQDLHGNVMAVINKLYDADKQNVVLTSNMNSLDIALKTLTNSHFVGNMWHGNKPYGISRLGLVELSFLVGLILGFITVFLAEIRSKSRKKVEE